MLSHGEMCFSGFRAQTTNRLECRFRQLNTRFGMVEAEEIKSVMRSNELAVGVEEERITRDSLIKKLYGLRQIFSCAGTKRNAIN
jgi:hypothetical protein